MPENPTDKLRSATGISKRPVTVPEMIEAWKPQIAKALMGTALNPERIGRVALTSFRKTPKLGECVPESVWAAIIISAQMGLELGTEAHLIPFGKECTLIIDYKGYIQLAYRSAHIKDIEADVVYSNDKFTYRRGSNALLEHEIDYTQPRGNRILAFAGAHTATGGYPNAVLPGAEIVSIMNRSSNVRNAKKWGKTTPWDTDTDEMWKKTAIRRLAKSLPRSAQDRLQQAVALDNAADQGGQGLTLDMINPDGDLQLMSSSPQEDSLLIPTNVLEAAAAVGSGKDLADMYEGNGRDWEKVEKELQSIADKE